MGSPKARPKARPSAWNSCWGLRPAFAEACADENGARWGHEWAAVASWQDDLDECRRRIEALRKERDEARDRADELRRAVANGEPLDPDELHEWEMESE